MNDTNDIIEQSLSANLDSARIALDQILDKDKDSVLFSKQTIIYYKNNGDWLWVNSSESLEKSDTLIRLIAHKLQEIGFNNNAFLVDSILTDITRLKEQINDSTLAISEIMARLEYNLSKSYFTYVSGQRYGFSNPLRVHNKLDRDNNGNFRPLFDIAIQLPDSNFTTEAFYKAVNDDVLDYVESVEPQNPIYLRLKNALHEDSLKEHSQKLLFNMERCRWQIKDNPLNKKKYILVNIPAQTLWAVQDDSALMMRICCGAFSTKTPMLTSKINLVQFNPEWGIPMSIIKKEVSEHAGDSAYFARHRYSIIHRDGDTINPNYITSTELRSGNYRISQKSGPGNSLGRIIFRFPNQFSVYLHDTNSPGAFQNERRTISHGCVRVQKPFELTKFVLPNLDDWTLDKIRLSVDIKPETEKGKTYLQNHRSMYRDSGKNIRLINSHKISPEIPLFIGYFTAYPNPKTCEIEFWPDRYEYDKQIQKALKPFLP